MLRSLTLDDGQIEALRREARAVHRGKPDYSSAEKWEELEIRAPQEGIVASVGVMAGGQVAAGSLLFRIAVDAASGPDVEGRRLADSVEP